MTLGRIRMSIFYLNSCLMSIRKILIVLFMVDMSFPWRIHLFKLRQVNWKEMWQYSEVGGTQTDIWDTLVCLLSVWRLPPSPCPGNHLSFCPSGWSGHVTWFGFEWKWCVQLSTWQKAAAQTPPSALLLGHGPGRAAATHPAFHSHLESKRLSHLSDCILGSFCYNHLLCILTNEFNCDFTQVSSAISLLSAQIWFTLTSS